jgi:bifunctional NMN adenylyltransferase/nudix hydrolase
MLSVIIGRFQTPYLHEGHQELIRAATSYSENVLVLIGCTSATGTDKNPMDFKTRQELFAFNCEVKPLHDMLSDIDWSDQIDKIISDLGFTEATIFGGKDNSIQGYYHGKHRVKIINDIGVHSSTALRKAVGMSNPKPSGDFRAGIIYAVENRYPIVYSTVDVAIKKDNKYLVGKKGDKYCFIGGFVDPSDRSLFEAAIREAREETGIANYGLGYYAGSIKIDDERYRGTKDSIMTNFFITEAFEEVNYDKIKDKEFKDFVWATKEELNDLLHDFHKPLLTFIK